MFNTGSPLVQKKERKKVPVKTVYMHVMRAKLFGILTVNSLEGIIHEIDQMLPTEALEEPLDVFSPRFRRYQDGKLMPTSYGDHLDRAAKSLCKDLGSNVTIELFNTQAIKKVISSCIQSVQESDRQDMISWLSQRNEIILKSERYESLINDVCLYFYKQNMNCINEDTLAFVRRSANELLRNKASKDALRKKLEQKNQHTVNHELIPEELHATIPMSDIMAQRPFVANVPTVDSNQIAYLMSSGVPNTMMAPGNGLMA